MTARRNSTAITREESLEMEQLFNQIKNNFTTCSISELERFTDLFTKTLIGKGDDSPPN